MPTNIKLTTFRWEMIIKEMNANFDLDSVQFDLHNNTLECKITEFLLSANPSYMLNSFFHSLTTNASMIKTIEVNMIEETSIPTIMTTVVLNNCHAIKYSADYDTYGVQPTVHSLKFVFTNYTMTHFDQQQKSDPVADYDRAMGIIKK